MSFRTSRQLLTPQYVGLPGGTGTAAPTANTAYLIPAWIPVPMIFTRFAFTVSIQAGNMDLGVYDFQFVRRFSFGSFAVPAVGQQIKAMATSLYLPPGLHWLAFACTAGQFVISNGAFRAGAGITAQSKAASFPLPATLSGLATSVGNLPCFALLP